jgi:hypothetical protein
MTDFIFCPKTTQLWQTVSKSSGGASAALHGYPWSHPLSAERHALPRVKAHKGVPGAAELPGDRLARSQPAPEPERKLLESHEEPVEEEGHLVGPQADLGKNGAVDPGADD